MKLFCPAKINLFLHISGKRDDGYHTLDSLVGFLDIGDTLEVTEAQEFSLTADGPYAGELPPVEDNLVTRAARALEDATGNAADFNFHLTKYMPAASGIGAGSADAAAAIRALATFWQIGDTEMLYDIALKLGADVPVCLKAETSYVSGVGEVIEPLGLLPDAAVLLVNPGVAVSTGKVFAALEQVYTKKKMERRGFPSRDDMVAFLGQAKNGLTDAAISLAPEISDALDALRAQEDCQLARMSGSGATCFGIFKRMEHAESAADAIEAAHADWWVQPARLMLRPMLFVK